MNISANHKYTTAITPTAGVAATTEISGTIVDCLGFNRLIAYIRMGTITTSAVTSAKLVHGNDSGLSDVADVSGATVTIADNDDDEAFIIELSHLTKRYARLVVSRGTQNAVVAEAHYELAGAEKCPVTQSAAVTVTLV